MTAGRILPWLQDTESARVWLLWSTQRDDVIMLDGENRKVSVYSLRSHSITQPADSAALVALLRSVAQE